MNTFSPERCVESSRIDRELMRRFALEWRRTGAQAFLMAAEERRDWASFWAHKSNDAVGMTWWNELTRTERQMALANASSELGFEASPADAWNLWRKHQINLEVAA